MALVSLAGFTPSPRYVPLTTPWTHATISESTDGGLTWTALLTVALAPLDADPTHPSVRNFTVVNATSSSSLFKVTFTDAEGNEEDSDAVTGAGYATVDEIQAETAVDELKTLPRDQADILRTASILAIEDLCGQSFVPSTETIEITTGLNSKTVFLPKRLRVLTAVVARHRTLALDDVHIGPEGDRITLVRRIPNYYDQALSPYFSGYTWRTAFTGYRDDFGDGPLQLTGDWGWEEVPEGVENALRWDMEEQAQADANALSPSVIAYRRMGLRDITQGNLRVQLASRSGSEALNLSASPLSDRSRAALSRYVWMGHIGELA